MARFVRLVAVCLAVLLVTASFADARGGGVGGGGGAKRGRRGRSASAQTEQLIQDTYRRDLMTRSRLRDW
jgi:hypothetical protein